MASKSRYVPPHLRGNNQNVIIANPDEEMGPSPNRIGSNKSQKYRNDRNDDWRTKGQLQQPKLDLNELLPFEAEPELPDLEDPNEIAFAKLNNASIDCNEEMAGMRYSRHYSSANAPNEAMRPNDSVSAEYELSDNFKTLNTAHSHRPQRRRRRGGNNSPTNNHKKERKEKAKKEKQTSNHTVLNSKGRGSAVPINWAQKLKVKKGKPHRLDSSQPLCSDGHKVSHVLEVLNMRHVSDIPHVSAILRHFQIEYNTLISVQKRWFVIFDNNHRAINALNIVKNNQFKLKRIDTNPNDVKMLARNVPPPINKK